MAGVGIELYLSWRHTVPMIATLPYCARSHKFARCTCGHEEPKFANTCEYGRVWQCDHVGVGVLTWPELYYTPGTVETRNEANGHTVRVIMVHREHLPKAK